MKQFLHLRLTQKGCCLLAQEFLYDGRKGEGYDEAKPIEKPEEVGREGSYMEGVTIGYGLGDDLATD